MKILLLLAALGLLAGCRLTSTEVEPALPVGPVSSSATLVYRANGVPIVANNALNLGTFLIAIFGDPRAVVAKFPTGGNLLLRGSDVHNQPVGYLTHSLTLELPAFHGAGAYSLLPASPQAYPTSYYYLTTYDGAGHPLDHAEQYPAASAPAQVIVTDWNPVSRHLAGTFALDVAGPNNPQIPSHLTEGSFDLIVD
ncbi:MAG: hypothetical protein ACRYFK_09390 [Janthinobacterium lividum]